MPPPRAAEPAPVRYPSKNVVGYKGTKTHITVLPSTNAPPNYVMPRSEGKSALLRLVWDAHASVVAPRGATKITPHVIPMDNFGWISEDLNMAHLTAARRDEKLKADGESSALMIPRGEACMHPAGPMLTEYAKGGWPVDVGKPWTKDEIMAAAVRGPHVSALAPDAIEMMHREVEEKVQDGFAEIVYLDEIEHLLGAATWLHLKIIPLAMVPHKSRTYRAILDLSFSLKILGMTLPSVNENTVITSQQHIMSQLGSVLPRLIHSVARAPVEDGNIVFSKLDIKDGYWRMIVEAGKHINFAYVLPDVIGERIRLVTPSALQMGWMESPSFFCAATETARDLAEQLVNKPIGSLQAHPLEDLMLPPSDWPDDNLDVVCHSYLRVMEVYVDDFCTMVQTSCKATLQHVSRALLQAIHSVFPPPHISGLQGGDPISNKKLLEKEGEWDVRKEILGWVFDGARRCIELPIKKIEAMRAELLGLLRQTDMPYKRFEKIVGKLRHAAIGLPTGKGLCSPFNRIMAHKPRMVRWGRDSAVRAAFADWWRILTDMKTRPTHVNELVLQTIADVGNMDASGIGAGGVWMSTCGAYENIVWRLEWTAEISNLVVSESNPRGTITNSDLEMAAILIQWLILEQIGTPFHTSALVRSDNTPACSWATRMTPKSKIAARLVRALALRQRISQSSPMITLHVAGKANDIADIPSRSFRLGHR